MNKIAVIALGCNKNQVDAEVLLTNLSQQFIPTLKIEQADIIVICPCAFLESARTEALAYIKNLEKYKNEKCKCLVVAGCYAQLLRDEIKNIAPFVDIIVGIENMQRISLLIKDFFKNNEKKVFVDEFNKYTKFPKNFERVVYSEPYTYLKIADGCNNKCSYCLIPVVRGDLRSRDKNDILREVKTLTETGIKEINIIAQDIGAYGKDLYEKYNFVELLKDICKIKKHGWIRLLYLHPKHINKKLIEVLSSNKQICKYLDLPIQHVNDKILALMHRGLTKKQIIKSIELLREYMPDIVIRTTFIVGFPSETKEEFNELVDFVKKYKIDKIGIFPYSKEFGTKAFELKNHVNEKIKVSRQLKLQKIYEKESSDIQKKYLNTALDVLIEGENLNNKEYKYIGRMYGMAPEIDGNVFVNTRKNLQAGAMIKVLVKKVDSYDIYGEYIL